MARISFISLITVAWGYLFGLPCDPDVLLLQELNTTYSAEAFKSLEEELPKLMEELGRNGGRLAVGWIDGYESPGYWVADDALTDETAVIKNETAHLIKELSAHRAEPPTSLVLDQVPFDEDIHWRANHSRVVVISTSELTSKSSEWLHSVQHLTNNDTQFAVLSSEDLQLDSDCDPLRGCRAEEDSSSEDDCGDSLVNCSPFYDCSTCLALPYPDCLKCDDCVSDESESDCQPTPYCDNLQDCLKGTKLHLQSIQPNLTDLRSKIIEAIQILTKCDTPKRQLQQEPTTLSSNPVSTQEETTTPHVSNQETPAHISNQETSALVSNQESSCTSGSSSDPCGPAMLLKLADKPVALRLQMFN